MALTITHTTVATAADDPSAEINKGEWNAAHTLAGDYLRKATVTLSSADILALHTTPVTLVAAPGAGNFLLPHRAIAVYTAGATPYTYSDGSEELHVGASSFGQLGGLLDDATDAVYVLNPTSNNFDVAGLENLPLEVDDSGQITGGDGTVTVSVWYSVEDVP